MPILKLIFLYGNILKYLTFYMEIIYLITRRGFTILNSYIVHYTMEKAIGCIGQLAICYLGSICENSKKRYADFVIYT